MRTIESIVSQQVKLRHKIYIYVYTIGKEEIFIKLAKMFNTTIVVDEDRYKKL